MRVRRMALSAEHEEELRARALHMYNDTLQHAAQLPDYGEIARVVQRRGDTLPLGADATAEDLHTLIAKDTWPRALIFAAQLCNDPHEAVAAILATSQLHHVEYGQLDFGEVTEILGRRTEGGTGSAAASSDPAASSDAVCARSLHIALLKRGPAHRHHVAILPLEVARLVTSSSALSTDPSTLLKTVLGSRSLVWLAESNPLSTARVPRWTPAPGEPAAQRQHLMDAAVSNEALLGRVFGDAAASDQISELGARAPAPFARPAEIAVLRRPRQPGASSPPYDVCVLFGPPANEALLAPGYDALDWAEAVLASTVHDADVRLLLPRVALSSLQADYIATLRAQRYGFLAAGGVNARYYDGTAARAMPPRAALVPRGAGEPARAMHVDSFVEETDVSSLSEMMGLYNAARAAAEVAPMASSNTLNAGAPPASADLSSTPIRGVAHVTEGASSAAHHAGDSAVAGGMSGHDSNASGAAPSAAESTPPRAELATEVAPQNAGVVPPGAELAAGVTTSAEGVPLPSPELVDARVAIESVRSGVAEFVLRDSVRVAEATDAALVGSNAVAARRVDSGIAREESIAADMRAAAARAALSPEMLDRLSAAFLGAMGVAVEAATASRCNALFELAGSDPGPAYCVFARDVRRTLAVAGKTVGVPARALFARVLAAETLRAARFEALAGDTWVPATPSTDRVLGTNLAVHAARVGRLALMLAELWAPSEAPPRLMFAVLPDARAIGLVMHVLQHRDVETAGGWNLQAEMRSAPGTPGGYEFSASVDIPGLLGAPPPAPLAHTLSFADALDKRARAARVAPRSTLPGDMWVSIRHNPAHPI